MNVALGCLFIGLAIALIVISSALIFYKTKLNIDEWTEIIAYSKEEK